ncbi:MAG: helix-turn-helix domain-containing protein [Flavobacteriales bacterium]
MTDTINKIYWTEYPSQYQDVVQTTLKNMLYPLLNNDTLIITHLSNLTERKAGKTTQEHIHEYNIEKVKNILLNFKESVSEIAYGLGFEYPQYFCKIFKRKTDLSPNVYRKQS